MSATAKKADRRNNGKARPKKPKAIVADNGQSVVLVQEKPCKHSVKYNTTEFGKGVDNVYVNRTAFPDAMPEKVKVTIYAPGDVPDGLPNATVMVKRKDCRHSVHYEKNGDVKAALTSLYVNRTAFAVMPAAIAVGVEVAR